MHKRRSQGLWWRGGVGLWLCLQVACGGGSAECTDGIQISKYNTSGLKCTQPCDCSNLEYEGYCISSACISTLRSPAQRKGDFRPCKLLQKVGACEWGQQQAQPTPLKELVWGDCKAEQVGPNFPENTKARCSDGIDNDCDGLVDQSDPKCGSFCTPKQVLPCYTADPKTVNVGPCRTGIKTCQEDSTWGPCVGEKVPSKEICNKEDDDCNGQIDDGLSGCTAQICQDGKQRGCYPHPVGCSVEADATGVMRFRCQGICRAGFQTCRQGQWGSCEQITLPTAESCDGVDNNCNGTVDEGCPCEEGKEQTCSLGPQNKAVGECVVGKQKCVGGKWGGCDGAKTPSYEVCDGLDNDCNGQVDDRCACAKEADCAQGLSCLAGVCRKSDCPSGQALCAGGCVDVKTSATHCGTCNNTCTSTKTCQEAACKCPSGQVDCGGTCVDTSSDGKHCGGCDKVCTAQEVCTSGKCALNCPTEQVICGGGCVNTQENSLHCGACGNACTGGRSCDKGTCQCAAGTAFCEGACVDLQSSSSHCGSCGNPCAAPRSCVQGGCVCPTAQAFCAGGCVDTASSNQHCGSCNNACSGGKTCQNNQCACPSGQTECEGACVDLQSSSSHCGSCGNPCAAPRSCVQGSCVCPTTQAFCAGGCVDTASSNQHCGSCNNACTGVKTCASSQCVCPTGQSDCGSGCIALTSDAHCGACNNACSGGKTCQAGQCACSAGLTDCSGTCVDTQTSATHCGMCGKVCVGGASCVGGQCEPPTSLAAGDRHVCALTDCNKLTCWGGNDKGQLGISMSCQLCPPTAVELPAGLDVLQVVAGGDFTCALFLDGSVRCWGDNAFGQLGYGDTTPRGLPPANGINLGSGRSAKKLSAGAYHVCVLLDDSSVKCWGDNRSGQLGYGDAAQRNNPVSYPIDLGIGMTAKDVSAGASHTCAILNNGSVKCWGENGSGQLGYGDTTQRTKPDANTLSFGGRSAKFLAVGNGYTCAILDNDTLRCWGANHSGQLGYGDTARRNAPLAFAVDVGAGRTVLAVATPSLLGSHTCALLDDGSTKCWGKNDKGQSGYGDTTQRTAPDANPINIGTGRSAMRISVGNDFTCAVLDDSTVKCWGNNRRRQIEFSSVLQINSPVSYPLTMAQIRCAGTCVSALEQANCGTCQMMCSAQQICFHGRCFLSPQIAVGGNHTCFSLNGVVKCWGAHHNAQLGYNDSTQRNAPDANPLELGVGYSAKFIVAGYAHTCAILNDDAAKCWGANANGQLGSGSTTNLTASTGVINLGAGRSAKLVAAGYHHTCAILDDNSVKCWGLNQYGELGYGDITKRLAPDANPISLGLGRSAKSLALGQSHTCAILDNNSAKCWGGNSRGQLGYGDTAQRTSPTSSINLGAGRFAKSIAVGQSHTCAILDDNTVKCWGDNNPNGQLGYGDTIDRNAPTANPIDLGSGRSAKAIATGGIHTCAILDNDSVKCWGRNQEKQLGYGDATQRNAPDTNSINLGAGRTAKFIAAGYLHTCVLLDDNSVKCWGRGYDGQLGYGDWYDRSAPPADPIRLP